MDGRRMTDHLAAARPAQPAGVDRRTARSHPLPAGYDNGQTRCPWPGAYSGRGNPPLTSIGLGGAAVATRLLHRGYHGRRQPPPLLRARQDRETIGSCGRIPVSELDDLTETDSGAWEG